MSSVPVFVWDLLVNCSYAAKTGDKFVKLCSHNAQLNKYTQYTTTLFMCTYGENYVLLMQNRRFSILHLALFYM